MAERGETARQLIIGQGEMEQRSEGHQPFSVFHSSFSTFRCFSSFHFLVSFSSLSFFRPPRVGHIFPFFVCSSVKGAVVLFVWGASVALAA